MVSYLFAGPVKESKKATDCEVLLDIVLCNVRIRSINPKICSLQQQQQQQQKKIASRDKTCFATLYFSESLCKSNSIPEATILHNLLTWCSPFLSSKGNLNKYYGIQYFNQENILNNKT